MFSILAIPDNAFETLIVCCGMCSIPVLFFQTDRWHHHGRRYWRRPLWLQRVYQYQYHVIETRSICIFLYAHENYNMYVVTCSRHERGVVIVAAGAVVLIVMHQTILLPIYFDTQCCHFFFEPQGKTAHTNLYASPCTIEGTVMIQRRLAFK